jgi:3-oxoacyl-[acyl-carrier protein] reductase
MVNNAVRWRFPKWRRFAASRGAPDIRHYSAANAGVLGLTRATAKEGIVQGVRVNAIAPGFIDTTRTEAQVGVARGVNVIRTLAGRLGTPEEATAAVASLVADDAAFFAAGNR